jgi:hypothetical protein
MATNMAIQYGRPLEVPTAVFPTAYAANPLGSWIMGDDARVRTEADEFFTSGLDEDWRIVADSTTVPDAGAATVELTFNRPPQF